MLRAGLLGEFCTTLLRVEWLVTHALADQCFHEYLASIGLGGRDDDQDFTAVSV
ncbi:MAG: hypothetical protein KDA62_17605 [Planctomycetales bacterium]|nr:hypothetical protein [Planctomycetales bacterium]